MLNIKMTTATLLSEWIYVQAYSQIQFPTTATAITTVMKQVLPFLLSPRAKFN